MVRRAASCLPLQCREVWGKLCLAASLGGVGGCPPPVLLLLLLQALAGAGEQAALSAEPLPSVPLGSCALRDTLGDCGPL